MSAEKIVLDFPPHLIDQPITYKLVQEHGLVVNILRARISPNEWGRLVVELGGNEEQLHEAKRFLKQLGVRVEPLSGEVRWVEARCTHCTACVSACPMHAMVVDRRDMAVSFDQERCIACELCLSVCPYQALEILFE
jgi:Fe-S-cluster-containing dehydrogenase component